jgi:hypothetical protein
LLLLKIFLLSHDDWHVPLGCFHKSGDLQLKELLIGELSLIIPKSMICFVVISLVINNGAFTGHSYDLGDDPSMETIELSDKVKLDESCVIVEPSELYAVARRVRKLRSYRVLSPSLIFCFVQWNIFVKITVYPQS